MKPFLIISGFVILIPVLAASGNPVAATLLLLGLLGWLVYHSESVMPSPYLPTETNRSEAPAVAYIQDNRTIHLTQINIAGRLQ